MSNNKLNAVDALKPELPPGANKHAAPAQAVAAALRGVARPLSLAQQRLWFADQIDEAAASACHIMVGWRLEGALNAKALQAALDRIVARHEVLRTTFGMACGESVQRIGAPHTAFELAWRDLGALAPQQRKGAVRAVMAGEQRRRFDLANGPPIRGVLLRLDADEHVLVITQHHIVSDGCSTGILMREVGALYAAYSQGRDDPLPPLAIQYADYAQWQRSWLQGERSQAQVEFWRRRLQGLPALLQLPTDRPRPARQSFAGARLALVLPPRLAASVRQLARRHGATLYVALLAGWSALLARLSGQDDIVVGAPVANRQRTVDEGLIGCFVNTLVLRHHYEGSKTVAQWLEQVRLATLEAYRNQELPFERVLEIVKPPRNAGHNPVIQAVLRLSDGAAGAVVDLPGLALTPLAGGTVAATYDLQLTLHDSGDGIAGDLEYAADLWDEGTMQVWLDCYRCLLQAMAADDRQPLAALPLLAQETDRHLLERFGAGPQGVVGQRLAHMVYTCASTGVPGESEVSGAGMARARLNQPLLKQQHLADNPYADGTVEHGWLHAASAGREIDAFVAERQAARHPAAAVEVETVLVSSAQDTDALLAQLSGLAPDLMAASRRFLEAHAPGSLGRDGFCRYALEGARDCYASRGINADVLARVLGLETLRGLSGVDLGFGNGEVLQVLGQAGACMTGFDLSPWFVQHARERGLDARMAKIDVEPAAMECEFRLAAHSQDFVISTMVLDRVASPRNYLKNMLALLKPGGRFALQTILPVSPIDDGDTARPIVYTSAANCIVPGQDEQQDKAALVRVLRGLGAGAIDVRKLPYVIASRDGLQHYTIWSFAGGKRPDGAPDDAAYQRRYHSGDVGRYLNDASIAYAYAGRVDE